MLKDEALKWRERLIGIAQAAGLAEDGKLYHDEVDGEARWAQRFAASDWPHAAIGVGTAARPGLRIEVWYRPGKGDDELGLSLLIADEPALEGLRAALAPVFVSLLGGGKTAGRYKPIAVQEPLAIRLESGVIGISRRVAAKPTKAEAAFSQLLADTLKPVAAVVTPWRAAGGEALFDATPFDPIAALKAKFGSKS